MTWGRPPLAVFADPLAELRDYLEARLADPALADRPEVAGAQVGLVLPAGYAPRSSAPFVRVASDGTPDVAYPIRAHATTRVTVWHSTTTRAKELAGLCLGLALTYPGGPRLARVVELTGVVDDVDPDNGGDIAAFTVRAVVRATVL